MRSPTSAALTLLLLAACGTWSNEDVRFLEALPTRPELRVEVPAGGAPAATGGAGALSLALCGPLGSAETWLWAKPTSDQLNASVDRLISLVDTVRRYPPTTRLEDGRIWGPFDDDKHPGIELRVVILRSWPAGPDGPVEHAYSFEARRKAAAGAFTPILSGTFVGASAQRGHGSLALRFDLAEQLGMADPDAPRGVMRVLYDRAAEPRTVALTLLGSGGFGLEVFDYRFRGYLDGSGRLRYLLVDGGNRAVVEAGFDGAGGGQADVTYTPAGGGLSVGYRQCWSADACLVYSDDVNGYSCGGGACAGGDAASCPAVPAP